MPIIGRLPNKVHRKLDDHRFGKRGNRQVLHLSVKPFMNRWLFEPEEIRIFGFSALEFGNFCILSIIEVLFMIEFSEIEDAVRSFDTIHPEKMKRYIHYRSFRNFVTHFDEIRDVQTQSFVLELLSDYVADVRKKKDQDFSAPQDWKHLAKAYLNPLSRIYGKKYGYSVAIPFLWVLIIGIIGDGILYVIQSLLAVQHVLFFTFGMLLYYCYTRFIKEPTGRVWGLKY